MKARRSALCASTHTTVWALLEGGANKKQPARSSDAHALSLSLAARALGTGTAGASHPRPRAPRSTNNPVDFFLVFIAVQTNPALRSRLFQGCHGFTRFRALRPFNRETHHERLNYAEPHPQPSRCQGIQQSSAVYPEPANLIRYCHDARNQTGWQGIQQR